ncbi:MAG: M23 family metallopeptidase, partial [Bacteroidota bacterium]|nr:M23 family metallopeptidase [Bacteroidota bacterium]
SAIAITATTVIGSQPSGNVSLTGPLRETPSLSASFAELRADHFHSGIDYRTGGVQGKDVLAVDDGYVYRIGVSPTGFGKALYVRHPSGYSSVYAHLRSFRPDIEEYVRENQYSRKSFAVSLFPQRNQFTVTRGEVIASSGNSGGSSGPHLHFEMRDAATEDPVNPLGFDLGVSDRMRPVIDRVILYPMTRGSAVNNSHGSVSLGTIPSDGSYGITATSLPVVFGEVGIGIKCWDTFDNSSNRCGVYAIELLADGLKVFSFTADRFSYAESRYINAHIDYAARANSGEYIHRLHIQPGDRLSMYDGQVGRGILKFFDDGEHEIKIIVTDTHRNKSWVTFRVKSVSKPPVAPAEARCSKVIPWGRAADFTADGIRVHFPAGSLYDTLWFNYMSRKNPGPFLSPVHSVHNETVAVHDRFRLSIRPDTVIPGKESKLCLARINNKGVASYAGGKYSYGFVSGEMGSLGDYAVTLDTVPPSARLSFATGANLTGKTQFTANIRDEFSGVRSYEMYVDGEWILAEYDAKNDLLICRPEKSRIKENTMHALELRVTDNCGNSTVTRSQFRW